MHRFGARTLSRCAILVAVIFGLTIAVPARVDVPGGGFPLSWLWTWATQSPAWSASAFVGVPVQETGHDRGRGHYVSAGATKGDGGNGRDPDRVGDGLAPYAPHEPQIDPAAAGAGVRGFDAGSSRRDANRASANRDVFRNEDGSITQKIANGPLNYRGTDGVWHPIDRRLERAANGRWQVAANSVQVSFTSAQVADGLSGATAAAVAQAPSDLATMALPSGEVVAYDLLGATLSAPVVRDSTATYADVLRDTDLELIAADSGIKETLILKSADAPASWVFPLNLRGLTPRINADGWVELVDRTGKALAWFPPGYMQDSNVDPQHGGAAESTNVTYELIGQDGGPALKVTADQAWLRDPARVYPVRVDPTATTAVTGDVFVDNDPSGPNHNGDNLPVGTWNGGTTKNRSFMHFDQFDDNGFVGRRITGVKLKLYLTWTYSCGTARPFYVHAATQAWTVAGLTTGTYPGPSISSAIGDLTVTDPGAACTNSSGNRSVGKWVTVPLEVATFDNWAKGGANLGLALTASVTDNYAWKRFTSANHASGAYKPYLEITYATNIAPQVTVRSPANNFVASTLTPQLSARAHDPDKWPNTGLQYKYSVYNETGATLIVTSNWVNNATWTVPAGKLKWGENYLYTVQVYDKAAYSAVYPAYAFSTPVPQPHLTSRLTQNADKGFDASIGNYTTSATDAAVATVGPELAIVRSYNSLDLRTRGAMGRGWSSIADTQAAEVKDAAGAVHTVVVTYPDGQEVAFGREANGTFAPPLGRFASFAATTSGSTVTGYTLTDKDATVYRFAQAAGTGVFRVSSVTDPNGRALTFSYDTSGQMTAIRSASGRSLHLTWATPAGSNYPHIVAVKTDPVTPGTAATALTWQYTYDNDNLVKVCDPASTTLCTTYAYTWISQFANAMQNVGPYSYWRLNDAAGSAMARSSMMGNAGIDNGVYNNVTLGQAAALSGSTSTSAGFNGTSSYVQLPGRLITDGPNQSISLWFKTPAGSTAGGVLAGTQSTPVAETPGSYQPVAYVGTDGKLYGQFWTGAVEPIASPGTVNDGNWHHMVMTTTATSQALYLDGARVGTLSKPLVSTGVEMTHAFLGTTRWSGRPATTGTYGYFNGSISDAAFFGQAASAQVISDLYSAGKWTRSALTKITRPSGGVSAEITYDTATGKVKTVKDENGGVWTMRPPTIAGNSGVYAAAVLGGRPANYWRLDDVPGDTDAVNEVAGGTASYNAGVTLGTAGPFPDAKAASFNGTSSAVVDPAPSLDTTKSFSVSAWVKVSDTTRHQRAVTVAGSRVPGVWLGYNYTANKWQATMYQADADSPASNRASSTAAAVQNRWTHLVATYDTSSRALKLYVDGVLQETVTVAGTKWKASGPLYIGHGYWNGSIADYWKGNLSEVATFNSVLSADAVAVQFAAAKQAAPVAITKVATGVAAIVMPVSTVGVTDPGGKDISFSFDVINGYRIVAQTDALGNTTKYGYDVGGYSNLTYDPRGVLTEEISDVRGNTIQSITCQDQAAKKCSSVYYTYFPDATTKVLTPDPRNDVLLTTRDGRSASATDNTYLTTYTYDVNGNQTMVTEPLGRKTVTAYTDGTTVPAVGGGFAPAGLPMKVTSPGGAVETIEYSANGDVARSVDALGKTTGYTYDGVGRVGSDTEVTSSFPSGLATRYTYDGMGRVLTQTEPAVTNRVTGAVHTSVTRSEYNADGFVIEQTISDTTGGDAVREVSTAYNAFGQMVSETDAKGDVTRYEYDLYGNMVKEIEPDGGQVANTYDAEANLLTSKVIGFIGDPNNPSPAADLVTISSSYDPAGRLASETDAMGFTTLYSYTDNGLVARISSTNGTSTFIVEENVYDAAGNLIRQTTDNGAAVVAYTYDAAGRQLTSTLDPNGLKRTTTHTYSLDDEVLTTTNTDASGTVTGYSEDLYDAEGNTIAETTYRGLGVTPAGRWKLGDAADSAGNATLRTAGTVTWSADRGGAAVFDGSSASSHLATAGPVLDTARSFTVTAWANPNEQSRNRAVLAQEGKTESGFYLKLDYNAGGKWSFVMYNNDDAASPNTYATSTSLAALNAWSHLAVVYDAPGKQLKLYVNGTLQVTKALNAAHVPWTSYGPLTIGRLKYHGDPTDPWSGSVSDVQAYQRVLTDTEIGQVRSGAAPAADAGVSRTSYVLDTEGLVVAEIDPLGNVTDYTYDEEGRAVLTIGPAVSAETNGGAPVTARPITTAGYNTFDELVQTKDPNGNVTVVEYDAAGQVLSTRLPSYTPPGSTTPVTPVTRNEYDASGNVISSTDALGNITTYQYDQLGRMVKQTAPNGGVSTYKFDLADELLSVTDANGAVTSATFDHLGQKLTSTQVVRQAGTNYTTTYTYNSNGRTTQVRSPAGVTQSFTYNAAEEVLTSSDGAGAVTRFSYDGSGQMIKTELPDGTYRTSTYDLAGRVVQTQAFNAAGALLTTESTRYDAAGNVIETTDARGSKNTFNYDATGTLTSARQPISATDAIVTSFGYDLMGNRTRFTDGRGNAFITTYNKWNLPESRIEPTTPAHPNAADRTYTFVYDAAGQAVSQRMPGGVSIAISYDSVGNVIRQTGSGAEVSTGDRVFGYDTAGRMTSLSGPGGTNTLTYDDRHLLLSVSGPSGNSSFGYNPDGAMVSRVDAAGTTNFGYDTAGRVKTVSNAGAAIDATLTYNAVSLVDRIVYDSTGNSRLFGYDALHRLTVDELKTPAGATVGKISYGWDGNGNVVAKTTTGFSGSAANTYTYDLADRLTSWNNGSTGVNYTYDRSGNRLTNGSRTFTYDARNRLVNDSDGTAYSFTPRGTLRTTTVGTVPLETQADAFGQVTRQYASASTFRDYTYDGLGRVMRTGFAYTGLGNHLAADGDATYARDPDGDLLGVAPTAGAKTLAWTDLHTDVVGQFAATGTTLSGSTTYDPLGRVLSTSGMLGNLGYQSEWTDAFTGRVNMLSRWYNTSTGQFDTRDAADNNPVPDSINANRYQYGDGNPLTVTDPTGQWGWNPIKAVKKAVSSAVKRTTRAVSSAYRYTKSKASYAVSYAKKTYHKAKTTVKRYAKKAVNYAKNKVKAAKKWVKTTYKSAKKWVKKKVNAAKNYVKKKVKAAKKWVAKKYNQVKKTVKKAYNHVKQAGKKIISKAKRVVKKTVNVVKDAYKKTAKWVKEHKAEIAGFVVGAVVGIGCGVAIGWTGVGAVACGALAGAAGSLVTGAMKGHTGMELVKDALIGGTIGAVTGGLFSVGGAAFSSGIRSAIGGSGVRNALGAAGRAIGAEARNIATGAASAVKAGASAVASAGRSAAGAVRSVASSVKRNATYGFYRSAAEFIDVSTKPGGSVFWSGPGSRVAAEGFAGNTGRSSLEMTAGGKWLDKAALWGRMSDDQARNVWTAASSRFAQQASGEVTAFTRGYWANAVFWKTELPALQNNPNVTNIFIMQKKT